MNPSHERSLLTEFIQSHDGEVCPVTHSVDTMIPYKIQSSEKQCCIVASFLSPFIRRIISFSPHVTLVTPQWVVDSVAAGCQQPDGFFTKPHPRICFEGLIVALFTQQHWSEYKQLLEQNDAYVMKDISVAEGYVVVADSMDSIPKAVLQSYKGELVSLRWVDCCFQQGKRLPFSTFVLSPVCATRSSASSS